MVPRRLQYGPERSLTMPEGYKEDHLEERTDRGSCNFYTTSSILLYPESLTYSNKIPYLSTIKYSIS
eukprot:4146351-Pyramimonas_sp.AAC.1